MTKIRIVIKPEEVASPIQKIIITLDDLIASEDRLVSQTKKFVINVPDIHCCYCSNPIYHHQNSGYCGECNTPYHDACWRENGGCGVFQCGGANNVRRYKRGV